MKKQENSNLRVTYALTVYGKDEIRAVNDVLKNPLKIVAGPRVKEFEQKISKLFGKKFGLMVNSGSSANFLAIELLDLPKGSEIITPALTFATTIAPIVQLGLIPSVVDVLTASYQIDADKIEELVTPKTKAIMVPSLIGNLPDFGKLSAIAKKHKLFFIEDSCDTLGGKFSGKPTGSYSDISTTSFYASHIITTAGNGGFLACNNSVLARRALVKSNWGRESTLFGFYEKSEEIKKRFMGVIGDEPYDAKFIFSEIGHNMQATEINAAFGLEQLKRFKEFSDRRKKNFKVFSSFFKCYEEYFVLPKQDERADTAWLAFPLTIRKGAPFTRLEITKHLEEKNIQTRPIFTGNVLKQPMFKGVKVKTSKGGYPVADYIMRNGFLIGCHHGLTQKHIDYLFSVFDDFIGIKKTA